MAIPNKELSEIQEFYDSVYYRDTVANDAVPTHYRRLAERLSTGQGTQVLDVACGTVTWLRAVQERGASAAGVDLSKRAIELCHRALPDGEFYCSPAEHLPFSDQRFDIVSCLGSLEHFVDPVAALREMVRVAKPDATFILLVPNKDFLTRRLGLYHGTHQTAAEEVVRTLDEWRTLFARAGLTVEERWKDLRMLNRAWVMLSGPLLAPNRLAQAIMLAVWGLASCLAVSGLSPVCSTSPALICSRLSRVPGIRPGNAVQDAAGVKPDAVLWIRVLSENSGAIAA
jgi:ubiquinone/menaquinone biosynthesis C-methylase UbiE